MDFTPLPQQRLAIEAPLGPLLVVAGPGAGKTFCLIGRIHHLITTLGIQPARICAVTFTNKAAEEIEVRLKRAIGDRAEEITRGTLHALCLSVLRDHAEAAALSQGFGVADEHYQRIVLARLKVPAYRRSALLTLFSRRRLQGYGLSEGDELLYEQYAAHLARRHMVDFDDLIARTKQLFDKRADVADAIAGRWDYLLVDEFQDLNPAQYEILKRLAAPHGNFFAVGDDEQSIFSWTGADPRGLVRFREDFEIEQPVVLDRNCRCSHQIFEAARRVLAENPKLFDKQLTAERASEHEVRAYGFADEAEEAAWLLADLQADRAASGLGWGDYAVLYRKHQVGEYLEGRLLRAGIPCRLARGRSIAEDEVVGYVIAALRVLRDPGDPVAIEALAELVFAEHLLQEVRTAATGDTGGADFLSAVRRLARSRPAGDPDTKKLWRFVYQVENLGALARSHHTLPGLVEELLSQSTGPYRNALEERHDELTDPADVPEAVLLARRLSDSAAAERRIVFEPLGGLEIALRGMLAAAGMRHIPAAGADAGPADLVIRRSDGGGIGLGLALFKALQLLEARELEAALPSYVTFDLETTDQDPATCGVVEIGAAKVVEGEIVERFQALVKPDRTISAGAARTHGYTDADVQDAPSFAEVWPGFRAFAGDHLLVAHSGQKFDVPVLRRLTAEMRGGGGLDGLVFYDTLPLARSLARGSARLADLAARFGIDPGRSHHALDDAVTLAQVFRELERRRIVRARKAVLASALDYLGLALVLEGDEPRSDERRALLDVARIYALGRYSDCLDLYAAERERTGVKAPPVEDVIERLGGRALMNRLRAEPNALERHPAAVARLRGLMDGDPGPTLEESLARLLERVALSTSEGVEVAPDRVNLLTLHSTKGLEFSRVYVVGVEDYQLPGYYAVVDDREGEIQEARRLLYVGMTRACDRLVLTRVDKRFGRDAGGSRFLEEAGLGLTAPSRTACSALSS